MTISKNQTKRKDKAAETLHLLGSQINLSPRPMPVIHTTSAWSSTHRNYPIRRSVSAFGFQQNGEQHEHLLHNNRPLSADNIRYMRRQNFSEDYRSAIAISARGRSREVTKRGEADLGERCELSENVYDNILNGYSENKQNEEGYEKAACANNLEPGLRSKPPLPPFTDAKCHADRSEVEMRGLVEDGDENLRSAAEKEAFDEIIALKFQRWFPNTASSHDRGSQPDDSCLEDDENDDDDDDGNVELLSYKERNYKTCEYRYQVHRKNVFTRKLSGHDDTRAANKSTKKASRSKHKIASPSPSPSRIQTTRFDDNAASDVIDRTRSTSNDRCREMTSKTRIIWSPELATSDRTARNNAIVIQEGRGKKSIDQNDEKGKQNRIKDKEEKTRTKTETNKNKKNKNKKKKKKKKKEDGKLEKEHDQEDEQEDEDDDDDDDDGDDDDDEEEEEGEKKVGIAAVSPSFVQAPIPSRTSAFKKSNFPSSFANPSKKQKKISFVVVDESNDTKAEEKHCSSGDDGNGNDQSFEKYFASTKSPTRLRQSVRCEQNFVSDKRDTASGARSPQNNRDATISPQQPAGSQIEDVLSWMRADNERGVEANTENKTEMSEMKAHNSMYEEMMDILKDIEKEDIRKDDAKAADEVVGRRTPSSSAKAIWSLIEEAEKANDKIEKDETVGHYRSHPHQSRTQDLPSSDGYSSCNSEDKNWNRLSDLLRLPSTELAQKAMSLQLLLEEREIVLQNLNVRLRTVEQTHQQRTQQLENSIQKQLKFIEQLKMEKKFIHEKMQNTVTELEKKHAATLVALDENHKAELKRCVEKQAAADKLERDRWLEMKTQKIRDLAIKGLEPELNRMATAHQEEVSEIRKFHKRQIEETEEAANRRMAVQKEKLEAEKEKALAIEREIWRQKLADEIGELEKRYQEQRKRLLAEVHVERENMERQNEAALAIKEKDNERKWEKKSIEMQKKIEALKNQHQDEIKIIQQNFESEKQIWMKNQTMELSDRESKIKEQCKKDRDKHIELIIQKLESENTERETVSEQKIKRIKEKYEAEIHDLETVNDNLKRKLNESREEIQKNEDIVSQFRAQLNQSQTEYVILKEKYDRVSAEQSEMQNVANSELTTRIHILQSELSQAQLTYESEIKMLKSENERELSQMYNKVKRMIEKKDELIKSLNKQKDAALKQCNQLEELLQFKRKDRIPIS